FWDVADSTGKFNMVAVPPGQYVFSATLDRNTNRRRDYHEPYDSIVVTLDSTVSNNFWTFVHDTVGPRKWSSISHWVRLRSTAPRWSFSSRPIPPGSGWTPS